VANTNGLKDESRRQVVGNTNELSKSVCDCGACDQRKRNPGLLIINNNFREFQGNKSSP
jgi:hypothetical protein